jgi:aldose 1-epimerase
VQAPQKSIIILLKRAILKTRGSEDGQGHARILHKICLKNKQKLLATVSLSGQSFDMAIPPLLTYSVDVQSARPVAITHFAFAPGIGAATIALDATVNGKLVNVFANHDLTEFSVSLAKDANASFKNFNVPLFPLTNRLLPATNSQVKPLALGQEFRTPVAGIEVKMPLNNMGHLPGAIPHHLHGLAYLAKSTEVKKEKLADGEKASTHFQNFFHGQWAGNADLDVVQSIQSGEFHYELRAQNTSKVSLPVAFGSHPYFQIPSGHPGQVTLKIPAHRLAQIDNLDNVLPTGKILTVSDDGSRLDFTQAKTLPRGVIDNFFFLDAGAREVELADPEAKVKYRMTALSPNIIGVQVYYPGHGSIIAIEMVTNAPDPRAEIWKDVPTGMQVLKPGENAHYQYKIAVESL